MNSVKSLEPKLETSPFDIFRSGINTSTPSTLLSKTSEIFTLHFVQGPGFRRTFF